MIKFENTKECMKYLDSADDRLKSICSMVSIMNTAMMETSGADLNSKFISDIGSALYMVSEMLDSLDDKLEDVLYWMKCNGED